MIHGREKQRAFRPRNHADQAFPNSYLGTDSVLRIAAAGNRQELGVWLICEQNHRVGESEMLLQKLQRSFEDLIEGLGFIQTFGDEPQRYQSSVDKEPRRTF